MSQTGRVYQPRALVLQCGRSSTYAKTCDSCTGPSRKCAAQKELDAKRAGIERLVVSGKCVPDKIPVGICGAWFAQVYLGVSARLPEISVSCAVTGDADSPSSVLDRGSGLPSECLQGYGVFVVVLASLGILMASIDARYEKGYVVLAERVTTAALCSSGLRLQEEAVQMLASDTDTSLVQAIRVFIAASAEYYGEVILQPLPSCERGNRPRWTRSDGAGDYLRETFAELMLDRASFTAVRKCVLSRSVNADDSTDVRILFSGSESGVTEACSRALEVFNYCTPDDAIRTFRRDDAHSVLESFFSPPGPATLTKCYDMFAESPRQAIFEFGQSSAERALAIKDARKKEKLAIKQSRRMADSA